MHYKVIRLSKEWLDKDQKLYSRIFEFATHILLLVELLGFMAWKLL